MKTNISFEKINVQRDCASKLLYLRSLPLTAIVIVYCGFMWQNVMTMPVLTPQECEKAVGIHDAGLSNCVTAQHLEWRYSTIARRFTCKLRGKSVRSWCDGWSDRSLMVDPLSYFSFQPVLYDWCNKGCGMCYPVCGMMHIKEPLLLIYHMSDAI